MKRSVGIGLAVVLLASCTPTLAAQKSRVLPQGNWGGEQIQLEISSERSAFEFSCAGANIEGPFVIKSNGRFSLRGTFTRQTGGAARIEGGPIPQAALFKGSVTGGHMFLTIMLSETKLKIGDFRLTRGASGRLFKCA